MKLPPLFASGGALRAAFVAGLERMLDEPGLGSYILVLANAVYHRDIFERLEPRLQARCAALGARLAEELRSGRPPGHHPDDLLVMLKLLVVGWDGLQPVQTRSLDGWQLQYNQLRSFRPARMSSGVFHGLQRPFDADGFHFNRGFLAREMLWEGDIGQRHCRLLYNKFPFAPLHGILVLDPERGQPQFLTEADHRFIWALLDAIAQAAPAIGIGYNSLGANASVNHQHFQPFLCEGEALPVESPKWRHLGGSAAYPLPLQVREDPSSAWSAIADAHAREQPYNLVYRPGRVYLFERRPQGTSEAETWASGFAWSELAGSLVLSDQNLYRELTADQLQRALARLRVA